MAKVGELERLVEGLVNRGLVAPKFVGRQVGQSLIDELSNLGRNVATSQATRQQEQVSRLSDFQRQVLKSSPQIGIGGARGAGGVGGQTKPFAFSRTSSGKINIATPTSEGFSVRSLLEDNPLAQLAIKNLPNPRIPDANVETVGGTFKNLLDLQNVLLRSPNLTDPSKITGFFQQLGA